MFRRARSLVLLDLVDVPVDLQTVAVGVAKLDRELTAGAPAPVEIDHHSVCLEPPAHRFAAPVLGSGAAAIGLEQDKRT